MLYRTIYLNDPGGYVVYRHCFDESKCGVEAGARAHKQAVFVEEDAARDYCRYRNDLIKKYGSDKLPDEEPPYPWCPQPQICKGKSSCPRNPSCGS